MVKKFLGSPFILLLKVVCIVSKSYGNRYGVESEEYYCSEWPMIWEMVQWQWSAANSRFVAFNNTRLWLLAVRTGKFQNQISKLNSVWQRRCIGVLETWMQLAITRWSVTQLIRNVVSSPSGVRGGAPAETNFGSFLANVNSSSCSLYVIGRPSVVCLSSVCL